MADSLDDDRRFLDNAEYVDELHHAASEGRGIVDEELDDELGLSYSVGVSLSVMERIEAELELSNARSFLSSINRSLRSAEVAMSELNSVNQPNKPSRTLLIQSGGIYLKTEKNIAISTVIQKMEKLNQEKLQCEKKIQQLEKIVGK